MYLIRVILKEIPSSRAYDGEAKNADDASNVPYEQLENKAKQSKHSIRRTRGRDKVRG